MSSDTRRTPGEAEPTVVNAFRVGESYLFRHYFAESAYDRLRPYYEHEAYRFAVPADAFDGLRRRLRGLGYELQPVTELSPYVVVVRQYAAHPQVVFDAAVYRQRADGHNCFLLSDREAVRAAVRGGATSLERSALASGQRSLADYA